MDDVSNDPVLLAMESVFGPLASVQFKDKEGKTLINRKTRVLKNKRQCETAALAISKLPFPPLTDEQKEAGEKERQWTVTVEEYTNDRTRAQNRLLHQIIGDLGKGLGYSKPDMKDMMVLRFLGTRPIKAIGEAAELTENENATIGSIDSMLKKIGLTLMKLYEMLTVFLFGVKERAKAREALVETSSLDTKEAAEFITQLISFAGEYGVPLTMDKRQAEDAGLSV